MCEWRSHTAAELALPVPSTCTPVVVKPGVRLGSLPPSIWTLRIVKAYPLTILIPTLDPDMPRIRKFSRIELSDNPRIVGSTLIATDGWSRGGSWMITEVGPSPTKETFSGTDTVAVVR